MYTCRAMYLCMSFHVYQLCISVPCRISRIRLKSSFLAAVCPVCLKFTCFTCLAWCHEITGTCKICGLITAMACVARARVEFRK